MVYYIKITDNYIPFHRKFLITGLCSSAWVVHTPNSLCNSFIVKICHNYGIVANQGIISVSSAIKIKNHTFHYRDSTLY